MSPELVARAQGGDGSAMDALLLRVLPRVRNLTRYLVRGDQEADDFAQEALIAVVRGIDSYRGEGPFEKWVDRVVVRAVFAAKSKRNRAPTPVEEDPDAAHGGSTPLEYLERRRVVRGLDGLPEPQRTVLVLHHAVGMTAPEIGEALGVSRETVRSRLKHGLAKLRAWLGEAADDEEEGVRRASRG